MYLNRYEYPEDAMVVVFGNDSTSGVSVESLWSQEVNTPSRDTTLHSHPSNTHMSVWITYLDYELAVVRPVCMVEEFPQNPQYMLDCTQPKILNPGFTR